MLSSNSNKLNNDNINNIDNNLIKNDKIKLTKNDIDNLDKEISPQHDLTLKEQENKILSGEVYKHINDTYYKNLNNYDVNKHGIGNSPIITEIKNINKNRLLTSNYISDFYGYDKNHLCHPNNSLYDFEILKNISNDYEFEYDYRNIGKYDEVINKYLHTNLINNKRHKENLIKILSILKNDKIKFDKKKIIIYYNEWLLNNNWIIFNNEKIIENFINVYKEFIHKYDLLFNKKIYNEQKKVNTTDYTVSTSSIFYEYNLNELHSIKNNNISFNYFNKNYFNDRPSTKYNNKNLISSSYSDIKN